MRRSLAAQRLPSRDRRPVGMRAIAPLLLERDACSKDMTIFPHPPSCHARCSGAFRTSLSRILAMLRLSIFISLFLLVSALPATAEDMPVITLTIKQQTLQSEVVTTPETRAKGLMNRFSLQPDHGMLFVFDQPQPLGFWMKNTYVPLSIAFIDGDGRILNIEDMKPLDESTHFSRGVALFALEMKQGWFKAKGIAAGDVVKGLPSPSSR